MDSLKLAMLSETPEEALNKFIRENPAYDFQANREIILERVHQTHETVQQAVTALHNQLAFNQEVYDADSAKKEAEERVALTEEIVLRCIR